MNPVKTIIAIVAAALLLSTTGSPVQANQTEITDAAYSWWVHPLAAVDVEGRTWAGSISLDGTVQVAIDGMIVPIDKVEHDEHNAPALAVHDSNPNRPVVAFNARHGRDSVVRYRTIDSDGNDGPMKTINIGKRTTYSQVVTYKDTIGLFVRGSACAWFFVVSDDWAKTWSTPRQILNGCAQGKNLYLTTGPHPNSALFRIAVYGHPVSSRWNNIEYGYVDLRDGRVRIPGRKVVANIRTGYSLPIIRGDLRSIYSPPEGSVIRMFDVSTVDGYPAVVFAEWDESLDGTRGPARYRTARWNGSNFESMDVGRYAGPPFWEPSNYLRGAAFSDTGELYTSSDNGLERWDWGNERWSSEPFVVDTSPNTARPYGIRGGNGRIMWQHLLEYGSRFDSYNITSVFS